MLDPNCSSKSAQCGQWKSSYKVIVTGASAEPSGMGRPFVRVTGLADTETDGAADGARLVRQPWNAIPPATRITTNAAIIMIKIRRSRFLAAACSAASWARPLSFIFLGPPPGPPPPPPQLPPDPERTDYVAATPATMPAVTARHREQS